MSRDEPDGSDSSYGPADRFEGWASGQINQMGQTPALVRCELEELEEPEEEESVLELKMDGGSIRRSYILYNKIWTYYDYLYNI